MKTTLTALATTFLLAVASAYTLEPPPNIRITTIPQLNNEEQVFLCPTDSNTVIANWRDFRLGYRQIGIGRSVDGGQTWLDSLISPLMQYFGLDSKQSDPTLTVDRFGNFYMSVLDWDAFGPTGGSIIAFYKSTDKGLSWTGPVQVPNVPELDPELFEDKQFITVDRTGGPHDGNIYCSWTRFPNPDRIMFVRSINGMASFEDTVTVGPQQTSTGCGGSIIDAGQFSIPIVTANGDVHVFWMGWALDSSENCTGTMTIKHVVSDNGGHAFSGEDTVLSVSGYTSASGGINTYSQPVGDADITGGPYNGNLYLAFTNDGPEDAGRTDVDFMKSTDNGLTWSDRLQINDVPNSHLIDAFHPWLIVNEEGVLVVVFYDQRFDPPAYYLFDLVAAYSFDGGETFTSNHRISDVSSSPGDLKRPPVVQPWTSGPAGSKALAMVGPRAGLIGEYIGVTAYHDKVVAVWTDSRDGNSEVYTANWYLPLLAPRLISPADGDWLQPAAELQWTTAWKTSEDLYRVELSLSSDFSTLALVRTVDSSAWVLDTVLPDDLYYWRVKALKAINSDSSGYSETWQLGIDGNAPDAPTLLLPPDGSITGEANPTFDWSTSTKDGSPVSYTLQISTDPAFPVGPLTRVYAGLTVSQHTPSEPLDEGVPTYWRVIASDAAENSSTSATFSVTYNSFTCGDIDGSGEAPNVADLTYLVDYLFNGGPPPPVPESADVDSSGGINVADLTYLVDYLFRGGPPPNCP